MVNDRLSKFEQEVRTRSEARDAELSEVRAQLAAVVIKQAELGDRLSELAAVVNAIRDVKPPSVIALWGPAISLAAAIGGAGSFVLTTTLDPLREDVRMAKKDLRDMSGLYGVLARRQAADEEKLRWHDKWIDSVQRATTRIDQSLTDTRVAEAER